MQGRKRRGEGGGGLLRVSLGSTATTLKQPPKHANDQPSQPSQTPHLGTNAVAVTAVATALVATVTAVATAFPIAAPTVAVATVVIATGTVVSGAPAITVGAKTGECAWVWGVGHLK